ncbi:APC family permease [Streptomyces sp. NP160]|uniref:APC family permease n=1 Tax=Streptomyces sp. NP160 TaxID=2586637 RepID=UPI00111AE589|nr:APC family permease [Streptomyces sp. NP160]TNM68905.1 APC family permease [Streptomyces sp. NP160]
MPITDAVKRLLVGRPVRSDKLSETLLPKRIALPVFASDALSSVAYAPDEILLTLAIAGASAYLLSPWIALVVVVVLVVVVSSYRQNVHAYPSGGGDYEVVTTNLGRTGGVTVGAALLCDYTLTVAVSVSSGAQYAAAALPFLNGHEVLLAVAVVVVLTTLNLRGVRESGSAFAIPTYVFMGAIGAMALVGGTRYVLGDLPPAESAGLGLIAEPGYEAGLTGLGGALLLARAFSSGCAALTGVEAISNGVPAFRKPKSQNAATTLALLGGISIVMLFSIILLARATGVQFAEDPAIQLIRDGQPVGDSYVQDPVIGQIAQAVFSGFAPAFYLVTTATGVILVLAANTAFNGFPVLASILARDGFLPRQLHTRGDRLAFSNGIIALAGVAIVLIISFDAQVTKLIQLYVVGVFISFTMSQTGMVKHWTRLLATETDPRERARMVRSRIINTVGVAMTGSVLVIVLITKFTRGAWITLLGMAVLFVIMRAIRKHYDRVAEELAIDASPAAKVLPSKVHAIVLVSKVHRPTLRALAYARVSRPSVLEALTVDVEPEDTAVLQRQWDALDLPVPLKALESPYREITRPIVQYVRDLRRESPRDLVVVYIPEYVVGHWWEQVLHNQTALRLKGRLLFTPGVVVASVPFQLSSSAGAEDRWEGPAAGSVRQGGLARPAPPSSSPSAPSAPPSTERSPR